MSKRYGRNQRRKHREAIALLTEATRDREAEAAREHRRADKLEQELADWNDEIIYLLGRYTAFQRMTPTMRLRSVDDFRSHLDVPDMRASMRVVTMEEMGAMETTTVERVLMHKLFVKIEEIGFPHLRLMLRLRIEDGHESRLAISNEELLGGLSPRDQAHITEQLTRELAGHFNKLTTPWRRA